MESLAASPVNFIMCSLNTRLAAAIFGNVTMAAKVIAKIMTCRRQQVKVAMILLLLLLYYLSRSFQRSSRHNKSFSQPPQTASDGVYTNHDNDSNSKLADEMMNCLANR
jgi:hypothetical protein